VRNLKAIGPSFLHLLGRMYRIVLSVGLLLGIGLSTACSGPARSTEGYRLLPQDTLPETERPAIGGLIATPCAFGMYGDRLDHLRDRNESVLVDLFFGSQGPNGPAGPPSRTDLELVAAQGGRVLHTFNVPAVRVRIPLSGLPDLVEASEWVIAREVPDETRFDVDVIVGFARALTDADVEEFEELGGHVTHRFDFIDALGGILPDPSIRTYQRRSDVRYLEANGVGCIG
jgi:hypothetical protein